MPNNSYQKVRNPGYLPSLLQCKCARCRTGNMFTHKMHLFSTQKNMAMPEKCASCGQRMEIEVGFYYGTGYVSYALTVAISVATFIAYWVLVGISINDNSLFIWLGLNIAVLIILLPYLMRLSRSIWLSFFVKYEPNWRNILPPDQERIVEKFMTPDQQ